MYHLLFTTNTPIIYINSFEYRFHLNLSLSFSEYLTITVLHIRPYYQGTDLHLLQAAPSSIYTTMGDCMSTPSPSPGKKKKRSGKKQDKGQKATMHALAEVNATAQRTDPNTRIDMWSQGVDERAPEIRDHNQHPPTRQKTHDAARAKPKPSHTRSSRHPSRHHGHSSRHAGRSSRHTGR